MNEVNQEINNLRLVDIVNHYPVSTRLRNCILEAHEQGTLPFNTISEFIKYGKGDSKNLTRIKNLGEKTADEFVNIVELIASEGLPEELRSLTKGRVAELPAQASSDLSLIDLVKRYPVSARLRNCILTANEQGVLPFDTIGEYIRHGEGASKRLFKIKNMGKSIIDEFVNFVELVVAEGMLGKVERPKRFELVYFLDEEYPGVFQPLIDMYKSVPGTDILTIERLEEVLVTLQNNKAHAEMVWFKFSGETLESIGISFGITRERVRQIINKYKPYVTEVKAPEWMSANWAEKSIKQLISSP